MLTLTLSQVNAAIYAANQIDALEKAKDRIAATKVRVDLNFKSRAEPLGAFMDYTIPADDIRAEIEQRLAAAHTQLRELGIHLIPG
jgi:hypothetical protein